MRARARVCMLLNVHVCVDRAVPIYNNMLVLKPCSERVKGDIAEFGVYPI
jgi:hypothetical protein